MVMVTLPQKEGSAMSIRLREFALACWCAFFAASGICTAGAQVILAGPSTSQKESPAPPLVVACSPTKPVVRAHESVGVVAFAVPPDGQPLQYTWKTEAGSFEVEGSEPQREAKGS